MGNLPPGIYEVTWAEFVARFGFTSQRQSLLAGLQAALELLAQAALPARVYWWQFR